MPAQASLRWLLTFNQLYHQSSGAPSSGQKLGVHPIAPACSPSTGAEVLGSGSGFWVLDPPFSILEGRDIIRLHTFRAGHHTPVIFTSSTDRDEDNL